jgi:hypothetical protein
LKALLAIIYEAFMCAPATLIDLFRKLARIVIANELSKWDTPVSFPEYKPSDWITAIE